MRLVQDFSQRISKLNCGVFQVNEVQIAGRGARLCALNCIALNQKLL
jgi:hypothetical protein